MSEPGTHEACGVVGAAAVKNVSTELYQSLRILQHRGQESAGIAVWQNGVRTAKGMGLVHHVIPTRELEELQGHVGIGHVRYSTAGGSTMENCQPIVVASNYGDIALGHNGEITNADRLRAELQKKGWAFITTSDSEIIVRLLANEISAHGEPIRAIRETMRIIEGAYSLTILIGNRVFAVRDPHAIRPLCVGEIDGGYLAASESVVFDTLGAEFLRDLEPGEILELTPGGLQSTRTPAPAHPAHCMFEWVYFARPDSAIDGQLVYDVRKRLGEILAREQPAAADIIVPIPDSGRSHALGFCEVSGLPYTEGLMKNRYIERTFIMPHQAERESSVMLKLNPVKSVLRGKRVVLIDDSIVRGTTMKQIVQIVRGAGAKEVHVRIGSPPIRSPCYLGIDMKTRQQFAASGKTVEEICRMITADSLGYLSIEGLVEAIGLPGVDLCLGCLTGEYPVPIEGEKIRFQRRLEAYAEASPAAGLEASELPAAAKPGSK